MARESTIKLEFDLEDPANNDALTLASPGITAGNPTTVKLDALTGLAAGDYIFIDGTGWPSLDGKLHQISALDVPNTEIDLNTNSTGEVAALPALVDITVTKLAITEVCLSDFTPNTGAPGEIDVTTMCDTERNTLPGLSSPGTASFTGMTDLDDAGMLALSAAYDDAVARWMVARSRRGTLAIFHGVVSSFAPGTMGVEAALTYTGNFTLDKKPYYKKAYNAA